VVDVRDDRDVAQVVAVCELVGTRHGVEGSDPNPPNE
jgi:hypothetical protein